ncbi:carboxymuconolactone decarboxylase family protein [Nocardia brasiliensis]
MSRLDYPHVDELGDSTRELLQSMPPLNILRMIANAPPLLGPWIEFAQAVLQGSQLDPGMREMVILRVTGAEHSDYAWTEHVHTAQASGVGQEKIDALRSGSPIEDQTVFTDLELSTLRAADEIRCTGSLSDASLAALKRDYPTRQIIELTAVVGFFMLVARLTRIAGVGLEPAESAQS